jgi:hypothetical protein
LGSGKKGVEVDKREQEVKKRGAMSDLKIYTAKRILTMGPGRPIGNAVLD